MDTPHYWFSAPQWGFGARLPVSWEGWLADGVWLALWLAMSPYMRSREHGLHGLGVLFAMLAILLAMHRWKGEPAG